jgi:hypothetical protein
VTVRNNGQRPNKRTDASKPTPTEVDRYDFAAKKTLGLFTSAVKKLAVIIIAVVVLFIVIIYLASA